MNADQTGQADPNGKPPTPVWLAQLRRRREAVSWDEFTSAHRFVVLSDIVPLVESARRMVRKSNAGRCPAVTLNALFTGMTLASWHNNGRIVLADVADILAHQLSPAARTRLGLPAWPDTADGFEAAYKAVRLTFHSAEAVMDPSPLPKRRLSRADAAQLEHEADQERLAAHRRLLVQVTNQIVETSLASIRPHIEAVWDGSVALDATPIRTFSRGVSTSDPYTATDPDAAWYVREGDHRDPGDTPASTARDDKKQKKAKRFLYGFEATLVVTGETSPSPRDAGHTPTPDNDGHLPALVLAFTLHKPGHDPAGNGLAALLDVHRRGYRPGWLAADRAYNAALPETFHIPVRDLGYRPIWDYRIDQLGIQGSHGGALLVDGTWYCPHLPEALINTTSDLLNKKIDKDTWRARANARAAYRLRPKAAPDHRGARRMLCPAAGTHPTVACPIKRRSLGRDPRHPVIDVPAISTAVGHPDVCRRESLTFARDIGSRHWQELDHGLTTWTHHYFRLRNRVEHFNGYAKDHEAIERSRTRRIRGVAAQSLLLAFQIAHANQRKISSWLDTLSQGDQPARRRPSNRHKLKNPRNWTPKGYLPDSTPGA